MRVLFDQGTPVPLRHSLAEPEVTTAYELGWSTLKNGELLEAAEDAGFEVLVTTDLNLRYQQNLDSRLDVLLSIVHRRLERETAKNVTGGWDVHS